MRRRRLRNEHAQQAFQLPEAAQSLARDHTRAFFGLLAPADIPRPIVDKLRAEIASIVNEPSFLSRNLTERGLEPVLNTPEEFRNFLIADRVRAERIVKASGETQK